MGGHMIGQSVHTRIPRKKLTRERSFTILRGGGGAEPIDSVPDVVRKEAVFYEILI